MTDQGIEEVGKIDGTTGNAKVGSLKNQIIKLETIQISAESGSRSPGKSPIKFNSFLDH